MSALPTPASLARIIEEAMLDKAPTIHRELKASGELWRVLEYRVGQAQTTFQAGYSAVMESRSVGEAMQLQNQAVRTALDQAVEFEESPQK